MRPGEPVAPTAVEADSDFVNVPELKKPQIFEQPEIKKELNFFRSSEIQQSVELNDFLENLITGNPYNKYCLDCKKAKSTHFLVWLGIFTCKKCADNHLRDSV